MSNENPNSSGMSALEKARLLKQQKEAEKQLLKEQEEQEVQNIEKRYQDLQSTIADLEAQKTALEQQIIGQQSIYQESVKSIRAAAKELKSDEESKELWEDKQTRQEIVEGDRLVAKDAMEKQKQIQQEIVAIQSQINQLATESQEVFKETKEGRRIMESQKKESEKIEKQNLQNEIKKMRSELESKRDAAYHAQTNIEHLKKRKEKELLKIKKLEAIYASMLDEEVNIENGSKLLFYKRQNEIKKWIDEAQSPLVIQEKDLEKRKEELKQEGYSKGIFDRFTKISKTEYDEQINNINKEIEDLRKKMDQNSSLYSQKMRESQIYFGDTDINIYSYDLREFSKSPKTFREFLNFLTESTEKQNTPSSELKKQIEEWNDFRERLQSLESRMKELDIE